MKTGIAQGTFQTEVCKEALKSKGGSDSIRVRKIVGLYVDVFSLTEL